MLSGRPRLSQVLAQRRGRGSLATSALVSPLLSRGVANLTTTYYRNWHNWSLNEGYTYLLKFPWINVCVTLIDRFFYFSIAFKTHSWRFSVKGKA